MSSKTEILNMALTRVGQQPVTNINDVSDETAQLGARLFESTLKEVLRSHEWNSCKTRASLPRNTTGPSFGWAYSYRLPNDCIFLVTLNGHDATSGYVEDEYEIEGRNILTDADVCNITYIQYSEDILSFDSFLVECLVVLLASKLASRIGRNAQLSNALLQEYEQVKLPRAQIIDGRERRQKKYNLANRSEWIKARTTYRP